MRFILLLLLSLLSFFQSSASELYRVTAESGLNVREGASSQAKVLGLIPAGNTVEVFEMDGDWARIDYKGQTAYVSNRYLELYQVPEDNEKPVKGNHGSAFFPIAILVLSIVAIYLMGNDYVWIGVGSLLLSLILAWYQLDCTQFPLWFLTEREVGTWMLVLNMFLLFVTVCILTNCIGAVLMGLNLDSVSIWMLKASFVLYVLSSENAVMLLVFIWGISFAIYRSVKQSDFMVLATSFAALLIGSVIAILGGAVCNRSFYGFDAFILICGVFPQIMGWIGEWGGESSYDPSCLKKYEVDYNGRRYILTQDSKYSECDYTDQNGDKWESGVSGFSPKGRVH